MDQLIVALGWIGIYGALGLGAIGSSLGCTTAGQAAVGAMMETDGGYGRFVGVAAMPSSQIIYGIVIMFSLSQEVTPQNGAGLFAIGGIAGLALLVSGALQGRVIASAIAAFKDKPEIFGLSLAPAAIVEGFAVFAFVFALVLAGTLPT